MFGGFLFVKKQSYVFTQISDLFSCSFFMSKELFSRSPMLHLRPFLEFKLGEKVKFMIYNS